MGAQNPQAPSLWHEMQQREADTADSGGSQEGDSPSLRDTVFQTGGMDSGGLFGDNEAVASPYWDGVPRHQPGLPTAHRRQPARTPAAGLGRSAEGIGSDSEDEAPTAGREAAVHTAAVMPDVSAAPARVARRGSGGEVSGSIVRSVFGAVRSGFTAVGRALLPPSLHKLLDGELSCAFWGHAASATAAPRFA